MRKKPRRGCGFLPVTISAPAPGIAGRRGWLAGEQAIGLRSLFAGRSFVESGLRQVGRHVVNVQTIAHAGIIVGRLNGPDEAVTVIVARNRTVKNAKGDDLASVEFDNLVPVLRLSSISIMHVVPLSMVKVR